MFIGMCGEPIVQKPWFQWVITLSAGEEQDLGFGLLLTARVRVLEVWIQAFVHELDHLVHSTGLDIIHELLQAGLYVEKQITVRTPVTLLMHVAS